MKFIRNQNINHIRVDIALRCIVKKRKLVDEKLRQNCYKNQDQNEGGKIKGDKRHRITLGFFQVLTITLFHELKVRLFLLKYMEIVGQFKFWQSRLHRVRGGKKKCQILDYNFKISNFKNITYKKSIYCILKNKNGVTGKITLFVKKKGYQNHKIIIKCKKGYIRLFTKSKDWTKDFILEIYNNKFKIKKIIKKKKLNNFKDGRSNQIFTMIRNFLKKNDYSKIDYCLNAERLNKTIN